MNTESSEKGEIYFNMDEVEKLIKEYKKIKKYRKGNLFAVKQMDSRKGVTES